MIKSLSISNLFPYTPICITSNDIRDNIGNRLGDRLGIKDHTPPKKCHLNPEGGSQVRYNEHVIKIKPL